MHRTFWSARWIIRLTEWKVDLWSPELLPNILVFHSEPSMPIETKKDAVRWQVVLNGPDQLKAIAQTVATSPAR